MNTRTAWTLYIVLRLLFFAVPFAALMLIGWPWWLAAITATLAGVSLSVIFLSKPRESAAESVYVWRHRERTADDIAEDAEIADAERAEAVETAEAAEAETAAHTDAAEVADAADTVGDDDPDQNANATPSNTP